MTPEQEIAADIDHYYIYRKEAAFFADLQACATELGLTTVGEQRAAAVGEFGANAKATGIGNALGVLGLPAPTGW